MIEPLGQPVGGPWISINNPPQPELYDFPAAATLGAAKRELEDLDRRLEHVHDPDERS